MLNIFHQIKKLEIFFNKKVFLIYKLNKMRYYLNT